MASRCVMAVTFRGGFRLFAVTNHIGIAGKN